MSPNAQWPASLPQSYKLLGTQEQAPNLVIRTQMDAGAPKTRKRYTAGVRPLSVSWLMNRAQKNTFDSFFLDTLGGGALPFDYRRQDQDATSGLAGFNECLEFQGRSTYMLVPDSDSLSFTDNTFTIEFWLRVNDTTDEVGVLHKTASANFEYAIEKEAGAGNLLFRAYELDGDNVYYMEAAIPDDEWHHWAWVCDGTDSRLYRDGTLVSDQPIVGGTMGNGTATLEIGRSTYYGLTGRLDELRIWSDARTEVEVGANMNAELVGNETDLVALWQFNEGSGITAGDSQTAGSHDGTIINAKWVPLVEEFKIVAPPRYEVLSHEWFEVFTELEVQP